MRLLDRLRRLESLPWILVAVAFAILLVLAGASVASYGTVAAAHARVAVSFTYAAAFRGLSPTGLLLDKGTVQFTIDFHVDDPTTRSLSFFTIGYRIWAEDGPAEAHLISVSRTPPDQTVANATGSHLFYRPFDGSVQTPAYPIPAGTNTTVPFTLTLTRASDSVRFAAMQNITDYAVHVLGGTSHIVWNVWFILNLNIEGIPSPASLSQAPYFATISRVQFTEGTDFGIGVLAGGP